MKNIHVFCMGEAQKINYFDSIIKNKHKIMFI